MNNLFASDNYSPVHPKILDSIIRANFDIEPSYGNDKYSSTLNNSIKSHFGSKAIIIPTLTGTGSNIISLCSLNDGFRSVIASDISHINIDEGGAPEASGIKILPVKHIEGKISPDYLSEYICYIKDQHRSQPGVLSITQPSEYGRVYSVDELENLVYTAKKHKLKTHLDGARLANAVVTLNKDIKTITYDLGFDLISFGATKNGAMLAESIIAFDADLAGKVIFLRKQNTQLLSKMRFISSQFISYLQDGLYLDLANNSNQSAKQLSLALNDFTDSLKIRYPVEANSIFATLPDKLYNTIPNKLGFYQWDNLTNLVRLMTSWSTSPEQILQFTSKLKSLL